MEQNHRINLAAGETKDIRPVGSGSVIGSMIFIDRASGEYRQVPDGVVTHVRDSDNDIVFRVTAPAGGLDGWIHLSESSAFWPDPVNL